MGNLFIKIIFVLFICLLVHRLSVRVSLPFYNLYRLILYWSRSTTVRSCTTQQFNLSLWTCCYSIFLYFITVDCRLLANSLPKRREKREVSQNLLSRIVALKKFERRLCYPVMMTSIVQNITKRRDGKGEAAGTKLLFLVELERMVGNFKRLRREIVELFTILKVEARSQNIKITSLMHKGMQVHGALSPKGQ